MRTSIVIGIVAVFGASLSVADAPAMEASASSTGRILYVASNGVDSINCGNRATPCRSITQAIANAVNGDQIEVGPGLYGDLNADGDLDDPGEEAPLKSTNDLLVVHVNKRLGIYSQRGAAATTIRATLLPLDTGDRLVTVVWISAGGVIFGRPNGGFTIVGGSRTNGIVVDGGPARVVGNIALNSGNFGFVFLSHNGEIVAVNNVAESGSNGFEAVASHRVVLDGNIASNNLGFPVGDGVGFLLNGSSEFVAVNVVKNCVSSGNGSGIIAANGGSFKFSRNTVTGNLRSGIIIAGEGDASLSQNSVIANVSNGITIGTGLHSISLRRNNIFGNGTGTNNCGVHNETGAVLDVAGNYWGAPSGPGLDPADNAGPSCDATGSTTITEPFATKPFPIN
jgi:hypothetical protein